jgi:hypothetical protein
MRASRMEVIEFARTRSPWGCIVLTEYARWSLRAAEIRSSISDNLDFLEWRVLKYSKMSVHLKWFLVRDRSCMKRTHRGEYHDHTSSIRAIGPQGQDTWGPLQGNNLLSWGTMEQDDWFWRHYDQGLKGPDWAMNPSGFHRCDPSRSTTWNCEPAVVLFIVLSHLA